MPPTGPCATCPTWRAPPRIKDLLYFALLERGMFMGRRGIIALSLPFGDAEAEQFAAALDDVLATHQDVLPAAQWQRLAIEHAEGSGRSQQSADGERGDPPLHRHPSLM
jgi:hypothetical protein